MYFERKGIFPALTTPFTDTDELDLGIFKINLDAQIQAGVHGIILGGSLGEARAWQRICKSPTLNFGGRRKRKNFKNHK